MTGKYFPAYITKLHLQERILSAKATYRDEHIKY